MGSSQTKKEKVSTLNSPKNVIVLHTTYFGSVDWYRQLLSTDETVYIDAHENYIKQTSRNRCEIATANGKQILTVPVTTKGREFEGSCAPVGAQASKLGAKVQEFEISKKKEVKVMVNVKVPIQEVLVSEHGNWRHQHWEALKSAYGMSPFFDYYKDDIYPFFDEETFKANNWQHLFDYNLAIMRKMLDLISPLPAPPFRERVLPTPPTTSSFPLKERVLPTPPATLSLPLKGGVGGGLYYQTFQRRHGFIPGLSILDLLFNEGPEAILYLKKNKG